MRVLVLGGCGFIGRYAVKNLLARGHQVIVGTRNPWRRTHKSREAVTLREARLQHLLTPADWAPVLTGVDAVINCVGILRERPGESYEAIHHLAPSALAQACRDNGIARLIHISALGLADSSLSGFCRSKLNGERALKRVAAPGLRLTIVRPSLLDGEDGFGAKWMRRVARWPVLLAPARPLGRIAPLHVEDLACALANLISDKSAYAPEFVELGGHTMTDIGEYLQTLRVAAGMKPIGVLRVPIALVRWVSLVCDALHFSPLSFGHVELLCRDNVPAVNSLSRWLGRSPLELGEHQKTGDRPRLTAAPLVFSREP